MGWEEGEGERGREAEGQAAFAVAAAALHGQARYLPPFPSGVLLHAPHRTPIRPPARKCAMTSE